jgi:hypothetical protein
VNRALSGICRESKRKVEKGAYFVLFDEYYYFHLIKVNEVARSRRTPIRKPYRFSAGQSKVITTWET